MMGLVLFSLYVQSGGLAKLINRVLNAFIKRMRPVPVEAVVTPQPAARVYRKITTTRTITLLIKIRSARHAGATHRQDRSVGEPHLQLLLPVGADLLLVLFSFNDLRSVSVFQGGSRLAGIRTSSRARSVVMRPSLTDLMLTSLRNSIFIGLASTAIATVLGTMVALSLVRGNFRGKGLIDSILYLPVVIPEITQAISLLTFFSLMFHQPHDERRNCAVVRFWYDHHRACGVQHLVCDHRRPRPPRRYEPPLEEAARDLGANEWRTFWRVTFPLILPGIISGALLAFTLSLDDFVVTFFVSGPGTTALPVFVYGLLRLTVTPEINAISTLMLVVSTLLISVSMLLQGRDATKGISGCVVGAHSRVRPFSGRHRGLPRQP